MNPETTCCFTGPRPQRLPNGGNENSAEIIRLKEELYKAVEESYSDGYRTFISGMAEGFDLIAAETVLELKNYFPDIVLICAFPYSDAEANHSSEICKRIKSITEKANIIIYVSNDYEKGCEHRRNAYMVERSMRIIGYYNGISSGTAHCWQLAIDKGIEKINLAE